jgi:GTP-binding protein
MGSKPLVAIVGRTNVGKSTLFNRLARRQKSITHARAGVTRDRVYAEVAPAARPFAVVDTGGLSLEEQGLEREIFEQAREAIEEADAILLVVDGREGLTSLDEQLAEFVRKSNKPVRLVVNKVDGAEQEPAFTSEFYSLGFPVSAVSAAHGYGCPELLEEVIPQLLPPEEAVQEPETLRQGLRLVLLGRPNVGKSSMINALLGQQRLIVDSEAGTTRDSVDAVLDKDGMRYVFLDTAGVRRKSRVRDSLERFSVLRALKSSKRSQVAILVLDAVQGMAQQDKKLLAFLDREKTPFIVAVNKVDLIEPRERNKLRKHFAGEMRFCPHVPVVYTSSVTRDGLGGILPLAEKLWQEASKRVPTGELNRGLQRIAGKHQPPLVGNRRAKMYYLTQPETAPPTFVFFVNDHRLVSSSYARYLEKQIRKVFGFQMAPLRLVFRTSEG